MHGWHRCFAGPFFSCGFVNADTGRFSLQAAQVAVSVVAEGAAALVLAAAAARSSAAALSTQILHLSAPFPSFL